MSIAEQGVTIPTKPQPSNGDNFVKTTEVFNATIDVQGKMSHELPPNIHAVKRVLVDGNTAKFKFDRRTHKLVLTELSPRKDAEVQMLAVVNHPVEDKK